MFSPYFALNVIVFERLRVRLDTLRVMVPLVPLLRTMTTALPLKSFISGCLND